MSDKCEQVKILSEKVNAIYKAVDEATQYASEHDLDLSIDGYGSWIKAENDYLADEMGVDIGQYGWYTSTMSCN